MKIKSMLGKSEYLATWGFVQYQILVEFPPVCPYSDTVLSRCKHYGSDHCYDCIPFEPLCDHYQPTGKSCRTNPWIGGDLS